MGGDIVVHQHAQVVDVHHPERCNVHRLSSKDNTGFSSGYTSLTRVTRELCSDFNTITGGYTIFFNEPKTVHCLPRKVNTLKSSDYKGAPFPMRHPEESHSFGKVNGG